MHIKTLYGYPYFSLRYWDDLLLYCDAIVNKYAHALTNPKAIWMGGALITLGSKRYSADIKQHRRKVSDISWAFLYDIYDGTIDDDGMLDECEWANYSRWSWQSIYRTSYTTCMHPYIVIPINEIEMCLPSLFDLSKSDESLAIAALTLIVNPFRARSWISIISNSAYLLNLQWYEMLGWLIYIIWKSIKTK